jgi:hypothetical protein
MFRWNTQKLIDLACIEDITIPEIAERVGLSVSAVEKFYNRNRAELFAARNETQVPDSTYARVMDLWGDGCDSAEIAQRAGLSTAVVRRLILNAEYDEAPESTGAYAELEALRREHPGRLYEDDVAALTEYGAWKRPPTFALSADTGLRQAA